MACAQPLREAWGALRAASVFEPILAKPHTRFLYFLTDSEATKALIQKGTSKSIPMRIVGKYYRDLAWRTSTLWTARHVEGTCMVEWGIDELSRLGESSYKSRALSHQALLAIRKHVPNMIYIVGSSPPNVIKSMPKHVSFVASVEALSHLLPSKPMAGHKTAIILCSAPHVRNSEAQAALAAGYSPVFMFCPIDMRPDKSKSLNMQLAKGTRAFQMGSLPELPNKSKPLKWPKTARYDLFRLTP